MSSRLMVTKISSNYDGMHKLLIFGELKVISTT